ncbi:MAG: transporter substrate-binding domain-containing protein, partial [Sneathiellales bacterium]|nr:transporter substrate-binding domain-containing protein [Sneathiellales bacterium]
MVVSGILKLGIFICLCIVFLNSASAQEKYSPLVFSKVIDNPTHISMVQIIRHIYDKLEIPVSFKALPGRRALQASASGETDGEALRVYEVGEIYKTLKRVPTPIVTFRGFAYTINGEVLNDWASLKNKRVGIIRGIVWAENNLKGPNIVLSDNVEQLIDKLLKGGIDVAVAVHFSVEHELSKRKDLPKVSRGEPLIEFKGYHYLNEKHEHLVPAVDKQI